jgi:hypothetical protein
LVPFLVNLVSLLILLAAVSIKKNKNRGVSSNIYFVEHPPNIFRLCLLDLFTFFCQLVRLNISQQQSISAFNELTGQAALPSQTFDTASLLPSNDGRNQRSATGDPRQDDGVTHFNVIDSDDAFHHNNVVVGLSFFQMLRIYNSRSQQQ